MKLKELTDLWEEYVEYFTNHIHVGMDGNSDTFGAFMEWLTYIRNNGDKK